jgi:hypothetical protein
LTTLEREQEAQHRPDNVPLSFGQLSVWRIIAAWPTNRWPETYLSAVVPVPEGCPLHQIREALRTLCGRHESLRTHFVDSPRGPVQQVRLVPTQVEATVIEQPDADDAEALVIGRGLTSEPIDRETDFGCRFTVVTDHGRPRHVVIVTDHMVADGFALRRLRCELTVLMGGVDADGQRWLQETPAQPSALALFQRSAANRPRREAALAHWRDLLATLSPKVFPVSDQGDRNPGRIEAVLRSSGTRAALVAASQRLGVAPHGVLLSLMSLAMAAATGTAQVVLTLQSSNRFSPAWRELVSSMNQYAPLPLEPHRGPEDFALYAKCVQGAALKAYRFASYDIDAVTTLVRSQRGLQLGFDHFYNFSAYDLLTVTGDSETGPAVIEATRPNRQIGPRFDVKIRSGPQMPIVVRADPRLVPQPRLHALLTWCDEELRRLAAGGTKARTGAMYARCEANVGYREAG